MQHCPVLALETKFWQKKRNHDLMHLPFLFVTKKNACIMRENDKLDARRYVLEVSKFQMNGIKGKIFKKFH